MLGSALPARSVMVGAAANGEYSISNLAPGTYYVSEVLRPGWEQTFPGGSGYQAVPVVAGQDVTHVDFGNRLPPGSISGSKWNDLDGDGNWDGNEPALPDWTIYLDLNHNGQLDAAATATNTFASADLPKNILDFATITSTQLLMDVAGPITDVNVTRCHPHL